MPKRKTYHVTQKRGQDDWNVVSAGNKTPLKKLDTQERAIKFARLKAKKAGLGQVKVHKRDAGPVRIEWTYGGDPEKYPS